MFIDSCSYCKLARYSVMCVLMQCSCVSNHWPVFAGAGRPPLPLSVWNVRQNNRLL